MRVGACVCAKCKSLDMWLWNICYCHMSYVIVILSYVIVNVNLDEDTQITIKFRKKDFLYCMVDGKVCNVVTDTVSNATCRFCKAKPSKLNDIDDLLKLHSDPNAVKYGICPMHARIRFLDLILAVSYRDEEGLRVKYTKKSGDQKDRMTQRKYDIQANFKKEMGLNVDLPAQGGGGGTQMMGTPPGEYLETMKNRSYPGYHKLWV